MRNSILINIIFLYLVKNVSAENINIQSKNIILDKIKKPQFFKMRLLSKTKNESTIKSDYAEYNKLSGLIKLKGNIEATDVQQNKIETKLVEYNEKENF